jgi:DNA (cytosine-5)-methyltransferase 1
LSGHPAPCREAGERPAPTLGAGPVSGGRKYGTDADSCDSLIAQSRMAKDGRGVHSDMSTFVAHSLRADGFDASEDGTGRGTPLIAFSVKDSGADAGDISPTLRAGGHDKSHANAGVMPAIAFGAWASHTGAGEVTPTLDVGKGDGVGVMSGMQVRRLTPRECERLQGFPDDYTLIPYRGKPAADGPRYKALGNSMAVPVMAWIGRRIALMDALDLEAAS